LRVGLPAGRAGVSVTSQDKRPGGAVRRSAVTTSKCRVQLADSFIAFEKNAEIECCWEEKRITVFDTTRGEFATLNDLQRMSSSDSN